MTDGTVLGAIGQVSLLCRSAAAAEAWYRDVLRLSHMWTFGPLVFFDCAGTRLFLREVPESDWRPSSILYFRVDDIEAAHRDLTARGAVFSEPPQLIHRHADGTEEWMAFFGDPDGNLLGLMSMP
jgi:catechol 2,3-dioxygenase-like lactoylglutathione lyase family enzyme